MSEADKRFKELGYKKLDGGAYIEYSHAENSVREEYVISFTAGTVMARLYIDGNKSKPLALEPAEIEAINMKCKELGWI